MVSEGFIVVDDSSGRILEANPVAATLLAGAGATLVGKPFPLGLGDEARNTLDRPLGKRDQLLPLLTE